MPGTFNIPMMIAPASSNNWTQGQLDPTPKRVYGGRIDLEIDGLSLNDAIEAISNAGIPAEATESNIELDCNDDYASVYIVWYRLETPEQVQDRIQRTQQSAQASAQRRREQYEMLRQEFENEV